MTTAELEPLPQEINKWEQPIEFTEDFRVAKQITFTAESYQQWVESILPQTKKMQPLETSQVAKKGIPVGDYRFYLRELPLWHMGRPHFLMKLRPTRSQLELYQSGRVAGYCGFDGVVYIPVLCEKARSVWMSLTPAEILSQRGQVRRAKKDTAIAGLGLGWAARRILERKKVTHLTVYERNTDVLRVFGEPLKEEFGDKLTLVEADAYKVDWTQHDTVLWDIWSGYGDAYWDSRFGAIQKELRAAGKVCEGWGQVLTR